MQSLEGCLLVASPRIGDPRFERTVVLLLQHDDDGACGVILNRPLAETVSGLWEKLGDTGCQVDRQLNLGGPVSGPIIALHGFASLGEFEVPPGLFVAEQKEILQKLIRRPNTPLRVFVGHAGWTSGQLEDELEQGAWHVIPARLDHVFQDHQDLWVTTIREVGQSFYRDVVGIRDFPVDATLN